MRTLKTLLCATLLASAAIGAPPVAKPATTTLQRSDPREKHLKNLRQITFHGSNAEAYWSADGQWLVFQSTRDKDSCDQIYRMRADGSEVTRVSSGEGRTTCSYWFPDGKRIVYASTHLGDKACPPPPDRSKGYVWPLFPTYDLFVATVGGGTEQITKAPGYDAEATVSPDGKRVVFTSTRDGDLELYTCAPDGSDVKRLTVKPGYDGGAFFSPDSSKIVYRSFHPQSAAELTDYRKHLAANEFRPTWLELFVMDADGKNQRQVTKIKSASFCPFFFPDGKRIIFSSNHQAAKPFQFELWAVDTDGGNLERVTFQNGFEGFPMFSPDGKKLVWGSNRASTGRHQTNLFVADWVP